MTPATLRAAAEWNYTKAMDALYWSEKTKNNRIHAEFMREAAHHMSTGDECKRQAWRMEHTRKKHGHKRS